jgi:ubiquinone/menaquinone biosynthesis C-methylase UbiE
VTQPRLSSAVHLSILACQFRDRQNAVRTSGGIAAFLGDRSMFEKSEGFYDAVYAWKDYKAEAVRLKQFIAERRQSPGSTFLDVACGTGGHIAYLRDTFTVEGIDINPRMLAIAQAKHPDIPFHLGDMVDFAIPRQFDVVASLFSSICYLKTAERLSRAVTNMARHVRPGGVLIVEPFFSPTSWKPRNKAPDANIVDNEDTRIVRMIDSVRENNVVKSTFHYLVGTASGVEHFTEMHEFTLFTDDEVRDAFSSAGIDVNYDTTGLMGRGLYIGTRASAKA